MSELEKIVRDYVEAYNSFDIDGMLENVYENVVFENLENGNITLLLNGADSFRQQAELSKSFFSEREQLIESLAQTNERVVIGIRYTAVLAMDFPNGMKKGERLSLSGESIFEFSDGKIIRLTDRS
ncbi:nuclear transport factor 2 family protein [Flavobacterium selenitireducens]|uniref:nuclear transport factor 2 family protein n=1 Tax=Flavobacterium selenitireducens TaxID=2722704 RepID=UPI00168AF47B|nr:nuclear transport factor 2 family protein [Flavobacterium selenitireducens]MBD3582830.1 nuclear transport factor 2 family protein [Flavobacterium selenitireducens]